MNKINPIELALVFGVVVALLAGRGVAVQQEELADSLVRLHVIANSDSEEDQEEKLAVRDAVLELVARYGEGAESASEMEQRLRRCLPELEEAGNAVLNTRGSTHTVRGEVTDCYFPTKVYSGFALPAGEYRALRVVIGEGKGQNWWCVAFPPLCLGSGVEQIDQAVEAGLFTLPQKELMTEQGTPYVLKFRCMELFGQIKEYVCRG